MMRYFSTAGRAPEVDFETALFRGLAPDGGLYFPATFPRFSAAEIEGLVGLSLPEIGGLVLEKWFGSDIDPAELRTIAAEALHFPIPLRPVGPFHILELFHGPTLAFKDVAAQTLSRLMSHFLRKRGEKITLLVATSGDTGGAIAHGFADVPNIEVFVLYPKGRVSALQEEQLTRVADNVHPLEIEGVFDDCQALVKQAFNDPELRPLRLTSANSISIGRLIPQIVYYVYAYAQSGRSDLQFVVPSGNFGNVTGGLFAREMGLPFETFIAANNRNDAAVRYLASGEYEPRQTIHTLSNAMDVGNPSNFVRIQTLYGYDPGRVAAYLRAQVVSDEETIATMQRVMAAHDYLLDPHTAVGWRVAENLADPTHPVVVIGTASPVKFAAEIRAAAGLEISDAAAIQQLRGRPARKTSLSGSYAAFKAHLLSH